MSIDVSNFIDRKEYKKYAKRIKNRKILYEKLRQIGR